LIRAKAAGVFQPVSSPVLKSVIPARYRDPEGHWFGLSLRSRVIFYAGDRVSPDELSSYEQLTDSKWRARICVRSSSNVYNQSLLASLVAHLGVDAAERWAHGLVANLARKPQGGDRDQIKSVAAGECDLAIANTYYYVRMLKSGKEAERGAAEKVSLFWPNQNGRGAHVNISGAGVTVSAKNRENAIKLIEFLVGDEAQRTYAETANEYPVKAGVPVSATVKALGEFKSDALDIATLAEHNAEAIKIFDRAGWR
jgi:iron(III) transport system substrate-binding protein